MITGVIVGLVAYVISVGVTSWLRSPRKTKAVSAPKVKLSWASKQIIDAYNRLPKDSQRVEGLESTLAALDEKFGIANVDAHFISYEFPHIRDGRITKTFNPSEHRLYTSRSTCVSINCKYREYVEIREDIRSVSDALIEQEKAIKMSSLKADLDNVRSIREAFRQELNIINETTKELS